LREKQESLTKKTKRNSHGAAEADEKIEFLCPCVGRRGGEIGGEKKIGFPGGKKG